VLQQLANGPVVAVLFCVALQCCAVVIAGAAAADYCLLLQSAVLYCYRCDSSLACLLRRLAAMQLPHCSNAAAAVFPQCGSLPHNDGLYMGILAYCTAGLFGCVSPPGRLFWKAC